jgi:hypothetical protein
MAQAPGRRARVGNAHSLPFFSLCRWGSHSSRRVRTCSIVGINGAAVLVKSKRRGLYDATMRAELEASFYTGTHGLGFINVLNELAKRTILI